MLSFRYLTDDHFWFTFFHESGHLLLHNKRLFLEGAETPDTAEELEANEFAARTLVPLSFYSEMLSLPTANLEVIRFARRTGVSPGIIVGQLQHEGRLPRNWLNGLKRRYRWED